MAISQADIERLLQGRVIIDNYRAKDAQGIDESDTLPEKLKAIGFTSDNPVQEFHDFNKYMNEQGFLEMNIQGDCDFCEGFEGKPHCQVIWGSRSCFNRKVNPRTEGFWVGIVQGLSASARMGADGGSDDWAITLAYYDEHKEPDGRFWYCPKGHGFYIDVSELQRKAKNKNNPIGKYSFIWR